MAKAILVTAATGTVGRHLVPRLRAHGHLVSAASRSGSAGQGNSVSLAFSETTTFAAALAGVDAAYLVVPTGTADPLSLGAFIDAAAAAGVKLVLQMSIGAES
jgi:uncharacterized protein YbjT (DUF2867 family)